MTNLLSALLGLNTSKATKQLVRDHKVKTTPLSEIRFRVTRRGHTQGIKFDNLSAMEKRNVEQGSIRRF